MWMPIFATFLLGLSGHQDPTDLAIERDRLLEVDQGRLAPVVAARGDSRSPRDLALRLELEPPPSDGSSWFEPLPDLEPAGEPLPPDSELARSAAEWRELARRALKEGRLMLADDFLRRSLRREPNDPEVRRLLGYLRGRANWGTPEVAHYLADGRVLHPEFGWVPGSWGPELDAGRLPILTGGAGGPTRWVPAAEADAIHGRDIERAWLVETPHFVLRASITLEEAVVYGRRLEDFRQLFLGRMADVVGPDLLPLAVLAADEGARPRAAAGRQRVSFYGDSAAYVEHMTTLDGPGAGESIGYYLMPDRARRLGIAPHSYFRADPLGRIETMATLFHEGSHQLLFELSGPSRHDRNTGHYWVFEGLGTYFESVKVVEEGLLQVGGRAGQRMAFAQDLCLVQEKFLSTRDFVRLNRVRFDGPASVRDHYAQAMALTAYLMDADGGAYREGFLRYVADAYRGRLRDDAGRSLDDRVGLSFGEIDEGLRAFLEEGTERSQEAVLAPDGP